MDGITTMLSIMSSFNMSTTYLLNISFEEGSFPELLKKTIVKPLFKKGDAINKETYRSVAILPIML